MYNIKITLTHKTINHNNIKRLDKCYSIIMSTYRHLKESNNNRFSILLYDKQGKLLRVTNSFVCGVQDVSQKYIQYRLLN